MLFSTITVRLVIIVMVDKAVKFFIVDKTVKEI
jgi:hypothetical protein